MTCGPDQEEWEEQQELLDKAKRVGRVHAEARKETQRRLREQEKEHRQKQVQLARVMLGEPHPGITLAAAAGSRWGSLRMTAWPQLEAAVNGAMLWQQAEEVRCWGGGMKAEGGVKTAAVAWTPATTMATPCAWEWSLTCSVR